MTVSRGTDYNSHKKQNSGTLIPQFCCVCVCLRRGEKEGGEGGAEREVNEEVGKGRREEGDYVHFGLILLSFPLPYLFWSPWGTEKEYKVLGSFTKIINQSNAKKAMC